MKESTLLEMQNKIASLTNVMQQIISETMHLRELSVGTLETLKLMEGYEEAIEKLKNNLINEQKQNGVIEQDTK
jgi:hypothetical protein